jgi:hypothetical protein
VGGSCCSGECACKCTALCLSSRVLFMISRAAASSTCAAVDLHDAVALWLPHALKHRLPLRACCCRSLECPSCTCHSTATASSACQRRQLEAHHALETAAAAVFNVTIHFISYLPSSCLAGVLCRQQQQQSAAPILSCSICCTSSAGFLFIEPFIIAPANVVAYAVSCNCICNVWLYTRLTKL